MPRIFSLVSVFFFLAAFSTAAQTGGFGINATRLIYPQGASSISVTLRNTLTSQPYLVQARISASLDGAATAPFLVMPPLFRLEPNSANKVRIVAQGVNVPADREALFYFHASAIPSSSAIQGGDPQNGVHGTAQFGVGNIIKLFFRPDNLPSTSTAAQSGLRFSRVSGGLQVSNPSAYHVSLASLQVGETKLKLDTPAALMIAPFSSHTYPSSVVQGQVRWQTINDEGGVDAFSYALP
ncbi:molecular chaperone [Serratia fonticola]|uniref:fimbrial biogenesis chaperone n=1 Tax=Serratia fonticola TaxID=47917 RepID=UPI001376C197|nr:molecular chaperone [Serratia fonticola]NCG53236.1 fimbria/pilus periplasmic chaperone [Serratia fonticola]